MTVSEIIARIYDTIPAELKSQLHDWIRQSEWDEIPGDTAAFGQTDWPLLMIVRGYRRDNGNFVFSVYVRRGQSAWTWGDMEYWFGRRSGFESALSPREAAVAANRYYPMLRDGEEHFLKMRRPRP